MNLTEAFKKLDLLEGEDFHVGTGIQSADLRNFIDDDDIIDTVDIIDKEAATEDELQDSYIGKIVIECPVCHSKFYKDRSELTFDDTLENVNLDEECPVCFSMDGYKIVGKITEFDPNEDTATDTADDTADTMLIDDHEENTTIPDVELGESVKQKNKTGKLSESARHRRLMSESAEGKHLHAFDEGLVGTVAGAAVGGALGGVPGAIAGGAVGNHITNKNECMDKDLTEDFTSTTLETEDQTVELTSDADGAVTITTKNKTNDIPVDDTFADDTIDGTLPVDDNVNSGDEVISPVSDEEASDMALDSIDDEHDHVMEVEPPVDDVPAEDEYDIDEFDEDSFDELGESYLKKVYENVNSYKTSNIKNRGNKIVVEGVIKFDSGNAKKTSFIFESYKKTKNGKLKFIGENAQITRGKKSFTVTGNLKDKKFITESLNYNYSQKDENGKSVRLYGTVKK